MPCICMPNIWHPRPYPLEYTSFNIIKLDLSSVLHCSAITIELQIATDAHRVTAYTALA